MNKKKEFIKAAVEVVWFEKTDVIATSTTGPSGSINDIGEEVNVDLGDD